MRKLSLSSAVALGALASAGLDTMPVQSSGWPELDGPLGYGRDVWRQQKYHAVPGFDAKARRTKNKAAKKARARNRR